jgi:PAS domain S-box-containing protein
VVEVNQLGNYVEAMQARLTTLYQGVNAKTTSQDLLPRFFMELGNASEKMQMAVEELQKQNEELAAARFAAEAQTQRYQELFEFVPDAYLMTDINGTIQEANGAAGSLLNISPRFLIGKPLTVLVKSQELKEFLPKLLNLERSGTVTTITELTATLYKRDGEPVMAAMKVAKVSDSTGKCFALRWLLHEVSTCHQTEAAPERNSNHLYQGLTMQYYAQGEIIPLEQNTVLYVCQGLVKLSAYCGYGKEILVGLVKAEQPLGVELTALQTYQAIALCDVKIASIPSTDVANSPALSQILWSGLNQRHKQTELLLFIAGQQRFKDRLRYLLQFLKQEIGEPVENGTRLSVRFTHEELASACHTTRVSITRALGSLKKHGLITFDSKSHIILPGDIV